MKNVKASLIVGGMHAVFLRKLPAVAAGKAAAAEYRSVLADSISAKAKESVDIIRSQRSDMIAASEELGSDVIIMG